MPQWEWHLYSEKKPIEGKDYLVGFWGLPEEYGYEGPEFQIARYDVDYDVFWLTLSDYHPGQVTHWAEIPERPDRPQ